jgi:hypothetical protein
MATTRTPIGRPPRSRITPAAIEAYRHARGVYIEYANALGTEAEGGLERAYSDANLELEAALARRPWQNGIFDVIGHAEAPPEVHQEWRRQDWVETHTLWLALEEALAEGST